MPTKVEATTRGRATSSASLLKPRDVSVRLSQEGSGYECTVCGAVSSSARLPLQPAFLAGAVEALRRELMKVVMHQDATGAFVFQTGIDIAEPDRDFALRTMARAGALLYQKLFFGPAAGDDSKRLGTFLRQVASDPARRLELQVVAALAPIPWSLLYVGDASADATLDWNLFLGMRHVIEEIPLPDEDGGDRHRRSRATRGWRQRQRQQRHRRAARRHLRRRHERLLGRRRRRRESASA